MRVQSSFIGGIWKGANSYNLVVVEPFYILHVEAEAVKCIVQYTGMIYI